MIVTSAGGLPARESLSVERTDRDDWILLVVRGELDLATEGQLLLAACAVLQERTGHPVVIDLSGLCFIDSHGLSELVMISHEATSCDQEVRVVAAGNRRLRSMLRVVGQLPIYDSIDDASPACTDANRSRRAPLPKEPPGGAERLGA